MGTVDLSTFLSAPFQHPRPVPLESPWEVLCNNVKTVGEGPVQTEKLVRELRVLFILDQ